MEIKLRLHWWLGSYLPGSHAKSVTLILSERRSIDELLQMQGIPREEVGLIVVNGSLSSRDRTLNDRDDVQLYPWLEGG